MMFSVRLLTVSLLLNVAITGHVVAATVFTDKNRSTHELPGAEQQAVRAEFDKLFASTDVSVKANSKDPWKAKEQRKQMGNQQRSATWGECRESALKNRFGCYRERKQPYHCELLYEARIKLCDDNL